MSSATTDRSAYTDIVFTGPPGPKDEAVFVEVEDETGRSRAIGTWVHRPDGLWALRMPASPDEITAVPDLLAALERVMFATTWEGFGDVGLQAIAAIARAKGERDE